MKEKLTLFGNDFVKSVRDNTLFVLEGIISGHMKSAIDKDMFKKIKSLSSEEQDLIRDLAYRMVDLTLHNMLFMFENNDHWEIISKEDKSDIAEISDGLAGELYTDDGWIKKFSEYQISRGL